MDDPRPTLQPGVNQVSTIDAGLPEHAKPGEAPDPATPDSGVPATHLTGTKHDDPTGPKGGDPIDGVGTTGEEDVWIGRYSMRNFLGWLIIDLALLGLWGWWLADIERSKNIGLRVPAGIFGVIIVFVCVRLFVKMALAYFGHLYRLTTRRLIISTGIGRREVNQVELLRVEDVYFRFPNLLSRILSVGNVVIQTSEKSLPNYNVLGVIDPEALKDLIWHHARSEQDQRNVRVESI